MTSRAHPSSRRRVRGFTLIEVMLAAVLGLIVILVAVALFRMMDVAKYTQAQRMENNLEFASAHRIMQQALRTLLMSDAPEPKDDELKERIINDLASAATDRENAREEDVGFNRFTLQPDPTKIDAFGRPMQTLELTLKVPPVRGNVRSMNAAEMHEREQQLIERFRRGDRMFLSMDGAGGSSAGAAPTGGQSVSGAGLRTAEPRSSGRSAGAGASGDGKGRTTAADAIASANAGRGLDLPSGGGSGGGSSSRRTDPATRRANLSRNASEFAGRDISEDALAGLLQAGEEPVRAPGVRGVFELRPEDDPNVLRRAREQGDPEGGRSLWAMWWREFPPDAGDGADSADLAELARYSRSDVREVKLISGLRQARWQVYRTTRGEQLSRVSVAKIAAVHARELPAYAELKFETIDGRREHWMFELAWSSGPEPGSLLQGSEEGLTPEQQLQRERDRGRETPKEGTSQVKGDTSGTGGGGKPSQGHTTTINGPK